MSKPSGRAAEVVPPFGVLRGTARIVLAPPNVITGIRVAIGVIVAVLGSGDGPETPVWQIEVELPDVTVCKDTKLVVRAVVGKAIAHIYAPVAGFPELIVINTGGERGLHAIQAIAHID